MPKRGFKNTRFSTVVEIINLEQLERFFTEGDQVNKISLIEKGLLTRNSGPVKLLGKGELTKKLIVTVDACSESALEIVKGRGGEVHFIKEAWNSDKPTKL